MPTKREIDLERDRRIERLELKINSLHDKINLLLIKAKLLKEEDVG